MMNREKKKKRKNRGKRKKERTKRKKKKRKDISLHQAQAKNLSKPARWQQGVCAELGQTAVMDIGRSGGRMRGIDGAYVHY